MKIQELKERLDKLEKNQYDILERLSVMQDFAEQGMKVILTRKEMADYMGVSIKVLKNLVDIQKMPFYRLRGMETYFHLPKIIEWITQEKFFKDVSKMARPGNTSNKDGKKLRLLREEQNKA